MLSPQPRHTLRIIVSPRRLLPKSLGSTDVILSWVPPPNLPRGSSLILQKSQGEAAAASGESDWFDVRPLKREEESSGLLEVHGLTPFATYRFRVRLAAAAADNDDDVEPAVSAPAASPPSLAVRTLRGRGWRPSHPRDLLLIEVCVLRT